MEITYLSQERHDELVAELNELKTQSLEPLGVVVEFG